MVLRIKSSFSRSFISIVVTVCAAFVEIFLCESAGPFMPFNKNGSSDSGKPKIPFKSIKNIYPACVKKIGIKESTFYSSVGTLGGGNHFIELEESAKDGSHYLTIHSGSRHFGLKVCNYHAKKMHKTTVLPEEYHEEFKLITHNTLPTSDIPQNWKS